MPLYTPGGSVGGGGAAALPGAAAAADSSSETAASAAEAGIGGGNNSSRTAAGLTTARIRGRENMEVETAKVGEDIHADTACIPLKATATAGGTTEGGSTAAAGGTVAEAGEMTAGGEGMISRGEEMIGTGGGTAGAAVSLGKCIIKTVGPVAAHPDSLLHVDETAAAAGGGGGLAAATKEAAELETSLDGAAAATAAKSSSNIIQQQLAKEDQFLQSVLRVTVVDASQIPNTATPSFHPPLFYLKAHALELEKQKKLRRLALRDLEEILILRLRSIGVDGSENLFRYISSCYHRSTDDVCSRCLPASQKIAAVQEVQKELVNYAGLLLSCPELFEFASSPPYAAMQQQLTQFLEGGCPASFFTRFIEELQQQSATLDINLLTKWFTPAFESLSASLNLHSMNEYKSPAFNAIKFLCSYKALAAAVAAESSVLLPHFHPPFPTTKPGFFLQQYSLLGRIYSPTLLDGPMLRGGGTESLSMRYFAGPHLLTMQYLSSTVQTLRQDQQYLQEGAAAIVKSLCRASPECRRVVLDWYGKVLCSNELRAKVGHLLHVAHAQAPESLDPMHAMLLKAQGQTTYGFSLNIFWSILTLVEPIKSDKIGELCYFFSLRTDAAAQQLLGDDLRLDAKLGGQNAVAAAKLYCQQHNILSVEPKFPTEIFWLALKAIRVLFNPSVTEFTRILQKLQSVHDQGVSPTTPEYRFLVAEVMSWRTVLLHPRFCSLYWNLLHLTLAWLLRCIYLFDGDGKVSSEQAAFLAKHQNRFAALVAQTTPPALAHAGGTAGGIRSSSRSPTSSSSSFSSSSSSLSSNNVAPAEQQQAAGSSRSVQGSAIAKENSDGSILPPQFAALPSCLIDDIFSSIRRMLKLQSVYQSVRGSQGMEQPPVAAADLELVAAACIAVMLHAAFFRNVHTRCDGACKTLYMMFLTEQLRGRLEEAPVVREHLFRALTEVFIASERGSYYDRITFRIPIVDLSQKLLVLPQFKRSLHQLATTSPQKFIHMIHLLLNDVSTLVDQAVSALTEVRRRQLAGKDHDNDEAQQQHGGGSTTAAAQGNAGAAAGTAAVGTGEASTGSTEDAEEEEDEEEEEEDGMKLEHHWKEMRSYGESHGVVWKQQQEIYVVLGLTHVVSLLYMQKSAAVTTLDCCLDHLVGPRCLQLKVNNMESYNFKPKDWLMKVLESYVYLLQADPDDGASLIGEILKDGRYFKKETANKACRIAKREGLVNMQLLAKFQDMVKKLSEGKEDEFDLDVNDFPAEYLDPIMADIMTDPVKLPTSNNVMDRKHIERHLMSEPSDPFNRIPLTKEDLIPMPELKVEILAFIAQKKAKKNG